MPRPPSLQHRRTTTTRMRPFHQNTMMQAYEDQHNLAESMLSLSSEQLGEQQLEERKLSPGWRAYRNEEDNKVAYFNEATNTSEHNFQDLFKKPRSKKIATTNHPGTSRNNNEPCRTSAAACQPAEHHPPPRPDQSNSSSTIPGVPYVTPTKSMKLPDPKEVIDLISSGSNNDETQLEEDDDTHLEDDDEKTDVDDSSSDRLPLTFEFENLPRSTTSGAGDDDDTSNACGGSYDDMDDKSVCLL
jgi:hypothetical protein